MNWLEWVVALVLVLAVAWLGSKVVRWTKGMPKGAYLLMTTKTNKARNALYFNRSFYD